MSQLFRVAVLAALICFPVIVWGQNNAEDVYKKVAPGIVLIKTDTSVGTGFILAADGTIGTALHVVNGANKVAVKTQSGDVFDDVSLLGQDERRDIAILKVNGFDLPTVTLGNSNDVKPGEHIFVIGNPLGAEQLKTSMSDGIVSGVRDLEDGYKTLQISAPISPGNSGGPALNENAETIGIVVFRLTEGENLNFAVPINYLRGLLGSIDKSRPVKQWKRTEASNDLFSEKAGQTTSRWKSITTGATYILRFQSEYVYLERVEPDENRKLGLFWTAEVKREGEQYSGTVHQGWIWWLTNPINGEKYVTDRCNVSIPMEVRSVSPVRIEGRTLGPTTGAKLDKKKCTFSGKPAWNDFVLIPE